MRQERQKVMYAERPALCEGFPTHGGKFLTVFLRDGVEELKKENHVEEGEPETYWVANEYIVHDVRNRDGLMQEITAGYTEWLARAKEQDYEEKAEEVRRKRDALLYACDYTTSFDFPCTEEERRQWTEYRQALRDIPSQEGFPYSIEWPQKPEKKEANVAVFALRSDGRR